VGAPRRRARGPGEAELTGRTIVWFRGKDLRLAAHAPLAAALDAREVIPLFVLDPYFFAPARARARAAAPHAVSFGLALRARRRP